MKNTRLESKAGILATKETEVMLDEDYRFKYMMYYLDFCEMNPVEGEESQPWDNYCNFQVPRYQSVCSITK